MDQPDLFPEPAAVASTVPTVESVRAGIDRVMCTLRGAHAIPWLAKETAMWKVVLPQMAN